MWRCPISISCQTRVLGDHTDVVSTAARHWSCAADMPNQVPNGRVPHLFNYPPPPSPSQKRMPHNESTNGQIPEKSNGQEKNGQPASDGHEDDSQKDPNVVDWDGPHDPEYPQNWPARKKWFNLSLATLAMLVANVCCRPFPNVARVIIITTFYSSSPAWKLHHLAWVVRSPVRVQSYQHRVEGADCLYFLFGYCARSNVCIIGPAVFVSCR